MSENKKDDKTNYFQIVGLSVGITILYLGILILLFGEESISVDADSIPISMIEPIPSKLCAELMHDLQVFKDYLGIEDIFPTDIEVSYTDVKYWNTLNYRIYENC